MADRHSTLAFLGVVVLIIGIKIWARLRPKRFTHDGVTYLRHPDGHFTDAVTGAAVTGAATLAAVEAAYALDRKKKQSSGDGDSGGDSGGGWGWGDSSCDGGDGGGGDGGGGGD